MDCTKSTIAVSTPARRSAANKGLNPSRCAISTGFGIMAGLLPGLRGLCRNRRHRTLPSVCGCHRGHSCTANSCGGRRAGYHLREFRGLDKELLFWQETGDEGNFRVVQVELAAVELLVHVGIGQKDLGDAAFEDHVQEFRALELIERLRRYDHGGVVLAPGLKRFRDVLPDAGVLEEHPRFVDEERLELRRKIAIRDDFVCAMQNVEEEGFEQFRVAAHLLEVEALKA